MTEFMVDFIEEHGHKPFRYGTWDCIQLVHCWLLAFNPVKAEIVENFLDETNYGLVKDEASYKRYLVELGVKDSKGLAKLFLSRGFMGSGKFLQEGDIFINPDLSMGVVIDWKRGLFLCEDGRLVIAPARVGSYSLSCRL